MGYQQFSTDGFATLTYIGTLNDLQMVPMLKELAFLQLMVLLGIIDGFKYALGQSDRRNHLPKFPFNCPCLQFSGWSPPSFNMIKAISNLVQF